MVDDEVKF